MTLYQYMRGTEMGRRAMCPRRAAGYHSGDCQAECKQSPTTEIDERRHFVIALAAFFVTIVMCLLTILFATVGADEPQPQQGDGCYYIKAMRICTDI